MTTIAVAVDIGGNNGGNGSKRAVKWAVENLLSQADHFVLVHVMPTITHIPTPSGNSIPITELDKKLWENTWRMLEKNLKQSSYNTEDSINQMQFETLLIEYDNIAAGLIDYIIKANVRSLVLGSESLNRFWRRIKGHGIPQLVLKSAPDTCDIFVVSKRRVKTKVASSMTSNNDTGCNKLPIVVTTGQTPLHSSSSVEPGTGLSQSEFSQSTSSSDAHQGSNSNDVNARSINSPSSTTSAYTDASSVGQMSVADTLVSYEQFDLQNDVEQLRLELQTTLALYNRACEDLVHAQKKVRILSSECVVEAEKVNAATEREETMKKIAEQEKMKLLRAEKDAQAAKNLLAKESYERQIAELNALKEFKERQKIVDALISNERRIRRYTPDEIRVATEEFSEKKIIGEGGYGKVYRGTLDHTPVAIKVLEHDATDKKEEFLREYMENGSLEELIFRHKGRAPLPWFARFRIAFEIACGLAFLHRRKPEPVVHRDLKPGNILLGRNYVTKISDVGLAKLVSDNIPDSVTMFGNSLLAGTLYYIDPEYQRTGTVRPKSDLYSFGIILLQLLTARSPNGLLLVMENAIASGSLPYILDDSIKDWPLSEVEELTKLALECCKLRCRDRPDLETVVLPVLRKLADVADASMKVERNSIFAPSHYFCPILHEIMDDPHVAADGFTYERRAIEAWLERHDISPVTKQKMTHFNLTPNMTLITAIQEWKSRLASTNT